MTTTGMPRTQVIVPEPLVVHERGIVIVRVFNASPALVFRAWTDPAQLAKWWGPYGCTIPECAVDLRAGGDWKVVMRSAEGVDHPINAVVQEVMEPARLVLLMDLSDHPAEWHDRVRRAHGLGDDGPTCRMLTTVLFEEFEDLTRLTMRQTFATTAERDAHVRIGAREGWGQSFDSLEELLLRGTVA